MRPLTARPPLLALLLAAPLAWAPPAAAQALNADAAPAYATLTSHGRGSGSAEATFDVRAESETPAEIQDEGCLGYVDPSAPDAVVDWGGGDLHLSVRAAFDPTLVVAGPDGWACNDDADGFLPVVEVAGAPAGRYAVWVGSFGPTVEGSPSVTLRAGAPPPPVVLDASAPAQRRVELAGGFAAGGDLPEEAVQAGGDDNLGRLDAGDGPDAPFCVGYVDAGRPALALYFRPEGGTGTLAVRAYPGRPGDGPTDLDAMDLEATLDVTDLTLAVVTPSGRTLCNDDAGGPDPEVAVEGPEAGTYTVWVGTYGPADGPVAAVVQLDEEALDPFALGDDFDFGDEFDGDFGGGPFSEGSYRPLDLDTVPAVRVAAGAEGGTVTTTIRPDGPNPVQGNSCTGFIEDAATAAATLAGDGPFALTASADTDLTLTVRTPSGAWFCSDDADGLDPGVQIDAPEPGDYLLWVGTFGDGGDGVEVTVAAEPGELVVSGGFGGPFGPLQEPQSEGTYDGTEIRAGDAADAADLTGLAPPLRQTLGAGGPVLNPVEGEACQGFVSERPTMVVEADSGVEVTASADGTDLTLVVLGPDGSWTCSDDADGSDPRAEVSAGPGVYSVWVGTFSRRAEPVPATVTARPAALPDTPPAPDVIRG